MRGGSGSPERRAPARAPWPAASHCIALGSSASAVFQLVLREAVVLMAIGLCGGIAGILVLKRSLDTLLFGVSGADPSVLGGVVIVLGIVAVAAGVLPARRATRIDPVIALAE